ncbi:hypothetical protein KJ596_01790 [Patescibacteria group bacterium]|nr:hypothetical protein [Patescibacteria group bacterium]MBU1868197.1 hypothetical protein [Patescibacteria group bacterium]
MLKENFIEVYTREILRLITISNGYYEKIRNSISTPSVENVETLISDLHIFLIFVSHIVKIIQPNVKSGDNDFRLYRAKSLKRAHPTLPEIAPSHIQIRNDFEHFDERLDSWVIHSERHNFADSNIGPINMIGGIDTKDILRHFDPQSMKLYFTGQEYDIDYLKKYINKVGVAINA